MRLPCHVGRCVVWGTVVHALLLEEHDVLTVVIVNAKFYVTIQIASTISCNTNLFDGIRV